MYEMRDSLDQDQNPILLVSAKSVTNQVILRRQSPASEVIRETEREGSGQSERWMQPHEAEVAKMQTETQRGEGVYVRK